MASSLSARMPHSLGCGLKVRRVADFAGNDLLVQLDGVAVLGEERWVAGLRSASVLAQANLRDAALTSISKRSTPSAHQSTDLL